MKDLKIQLSSEVEEGKKLSKPIVALETTIVSHGMPYPDNLNTALEVENIIREEGAIPATIGVVGGKIKIGMSKQEIELFAKGSDIKKVSRRDIPIVMSNNANGATTVAGTILLSKLAGIDVMATGGIGGVHRDAENTFDISADLQELSKTGVAVVCAGPKSILDIGCGYGANKYATTVSDILDLSNHYKDKSFVKITEKKLPFKDKEFDFVIASHVAEHVEDVSYFLNELSRVGKKGYIEVPTRLEDNLVFENKKAHIWHLVFDDVNNLSLIHISEPTRPY